MTETEALDMIKLAVVIAVMISASIGDWRRREVSDLHWIVLGVFGVVCMMYSFFSGSIRIEYVMVTIGTVMILSDILWDRERKPSVSVLFYVVMASMFILPLIYAWGDPDVTKLMTIPAAFVIFVVMFYAGILKGGADVKCLIVLAIIFYAYPSFLGFPIIAAPDEAISAIFQFPLMVLFFAALFSLPAGFYYMGVNIARRDTEFPYMFLGFRMSVSDAKNAHVWPMQNVVDGNIVKTRKAQDPEVLSDLEQAGAEKIWVTAMVPFLIPVTVSILFVAFVGNLLFALF